MASMTSRAALETVAPRATAPAFRPSVGPSTVAVTPLQQRQSRVSVATRAVPPIQANAAELALDPSLPPLDDPSVPTPVVPCGPMMADFLLAYRRVLQTATFSGDSAAAAGASVLSCIRAGLSELLGRPHHSAQWRREEGGLEQCLWELEKDIERLQQFKDRRPASLAVQLAALRCTEAARMLRKLTRQ